MKKKSVIIGANISTTVALFLLVTALAVPPVSASNNDCIDIDCLKQKLERICKEGTAPPYLDCGNILRCIDAGEQEIMRECARGYLLLQLQNETETCNSLTIMYLAKH
jgi:hypothetical protein